MTLMLMETMYYSILITQIRNEATLILHLYIARECNEFKHIMPESKRFYIILVCKFAIHSRGFILTPRLNSSLCARNIQWHF